MADGLTELVDAFRTFDGENTGLISKEDLRPILRDLGEQPLSDEEVDGFMRSIQHLEVNGRYPYVQLARDLLGLDADNDRVETSPPELPTGDSVNDDASPTFMPN